MRAKKERKVPIGLNENLTIQAGFEFCLFMRHVVFQEVRICPLLEENLLGCRYEVLIYELICHRGEKNNMGKQRSKRKRNSTHIIGQRGEDAAVGAQLPRGSHVKLVCLILDSRQSMQFGEGF